MGSLVAEAMERIKGVTMPLGYRMVWSGRFEDQQRALARLYVIVPLVIFIIFILLFGAFQSVGDALLIMLNLPFALIGGTLALWLWGANFNISAAVGYIAVFGVSVLNGVVLVSSIRQARTEEGLSIHDAVIRACVIRFRPIVVSAIVAVIGFLPAALSQGIGAEIQRPLARVVIGGLISSTALTLLVLPALCALFSGREIRFRAIVVSAIVAVIGFLPAALSHGIGSEIQRPLARVVIGGLVSSTALTLLVLPAVYALLAGRQGAR